MHVVGEWLSDGKYDYIKAKFWFRMKTHHPCCYVYCDRNE